MLQIVAAEVEDFKLYEQHAGNLVDPAQFRAIKAVRDGKIIGIVGYDNWTPASVQMHVWAEKGAWAGGKLLKEAFTYPFVQCKRIVAYGVIPSDNERALKFIRHVGFQEITRLRDGWSSGVDLVVNEIRPGTCRWL
jgi:RimJ/RimL family protein N-acetyltransferase